jgi:hypothetical protein
MSMFVINARKLEAAPPVPEKVVSAGFLKIVSIFRISRCIL